MEDVSENHDESKAAGSGKRWFAVCTDIFEHPIVGMDVPTPRAATPERHAWHPLMAWQWLIKEAAWRDRVVFIQGVAIPLKRGQLCHSQRHLAEQFNWGRQAVREFLSRLERHEMITFTASRSAVKCNPATTHGTSVISLVNYATYQTPTQVRNPRSNPGATQEQPRSNPKQYKVTSIQVNKIHTQPASVAPTYANDAPARQELAGLNGSADPMIEDILAWMHGGTRANAEQWLATTLKQYGQDLTRDSYAKLKAELASGAIIARKIPAWVAIAQRMQREGAGAKKKIKPSRW